MQARWIDDGAALDALAAELASADRVAVDVEGDGFFRYRARLCTMQLGWSDSIAVIDTLAITDLSPLSLLFAASGPSKLVHDAAFDVRLLRDAGLAVGNVFDTSVAARFLGEPATGLASLVHKYFGVTLDKEPQQMDWGRRPLDAALLRYLADDVRYLAPLAERLQTSAVSRGVMAEILEESRYVVERALEPPEAPSPPWLRVKGARELPPQDLGVLRALAWWRDAQAQAQDVPPFRVLHDGALLALARRKPRDRRELRGLRLPPACAQMALQALLDSIARGVAAGPPPPGELQALRGTPPTPEQRKLERARNKLLSQWREAQAKERAVDPQVVLPGHCLKDLVRHGAHDLRGLADIPGLGELRITRDGDRILAALKTAERQAAEG